MIHLDGWTENLVPYNQDDIVDTWEITNGAAGFNSRSRHVVYVGGRGKNGKPEDTRTDYQRNAIRAYVVRTVQRYPWIKIVGHTALNPGKACPSFDVAKFCREIGISEANIY
jgi:hypothetical protein